MALSPRLMKRKRVFILSGDGEFAESDYVDIPVIAEISLLGTRGQEFRYRFHNAFGAEGRIVRIKKVGSATGSFGSATVSLDQYVNAERVRTVPFPNAIETTQAWRMDKKLQNLDPAPAQPDGSNDPAHLKVHYVRFYQNNDIDGNFWVDTEMIDRMSLLSLNGQEYWYKIRHPTPEEYAEMAGDDSFGQVVDDEDDPYTPIIGWCDPTFSLLGAEFDDDGNIRPTRTDPLQNICNIGGGNAVVFFKDHD